jgi:hypothetical protein
MSDRQALMSEPGQFEMETGPFYSAEEEESRYTGNWSDELFHFLSHIGSCLMCTFVCFTPVLLWQVLSRLPRGDSMQLLPLGLSRVSVAALGYGLCVAALIFLHGALALLGVIGAVVILEQTARMVMGRYKLEDPPKVELWLQAICCHGCLLARLARHVGRARGFIPPLHGYGVEVLPPPVVVV